MIQGAGESPDGNSLKGVQGRHTGLTALPVHVRVHSMAQLRASQGTSWSVSKGVIYYCPPPQALGHKQLGVMVSSCVHPIPTLPGPPEKSPALRFDTLEYFQDKEDDLDKPYSDRSYLSSEGLARDDSRTGEPPTQTAAVRGTPHAPPQQQDLLPRVCGPADEWPRAVAPHIQRRGQGSLYPAALLPALLHQLRTVSPAPVPCPAQHSRQPSGKGGMQPCLCL